MCRSCINIERAKLDPFIEWDTHGRVRFANCVRAEGRFADRVWSVFRNAPRVERKQRRKPLDTSVVVRKASAAITKAAALSEARRWIPMNPLQAYAMLAEDARLAKRANRRR
jgi:hypothetical protein